MGGDYNKAVAQQRQGPDAIPSLDTVGLFSLVPLITSTIPSPTAITTTSSTITTPMTTSRIQYSKPGKAGAPFTSGQAVSTFSATVTSNTLIASAYTPTTFETVVRSLRQQLLLLLPPLRRRRMMFVKSEGEEVGSELLSGETFLGDG